MKAILKTIKNCKNDIPESVIPLFEHIVDSYNGDECEHHFMMAMEEHLTKEQRFRIYEKHGSCKGAKYDKGRVEFALKHAHLPLSERFKVFTETYGWKAVLNEDNTITVNFKCGHGYYLHAPKGKFKWLASVETYFERCAGGRLYELEKALGIKLKIKSVDVSPLKENIVNPVVFTFEVV